MRQKMTKEEKELRAAAATGDESQFHTAVRSAIKSDGLACLEAIRRNELLLACRTATGRAAVRRAYMSALLDAKVPQEALRTETIYVSYCELIGDLRDAVALDAADRASALDHFEFRDAAEVCVRVVASSIRRFLSMVVRTRDAAVEQHPLRSAALVSDVSHEIGGRYSLLPHMLKEVYRACRSPSPSQSPRGCTVGAAKELFRLAEEWQALSYLRQEVAFGEIRVERVEQGDPGARVFVVPNRIVETWRRPAMERRLSGLHTQRRLESLTLPTFPIHLARLVEFVAQMLPEPQTSAEISAAVLADLQIELGATLQPVDVLLIARAPTRIAQLTLALWAGNIFASAIGQFAIRVLRDHKTYGRRWPFTLTFAKDVIRHVLVACTGVSVDVAADALIELTSDLEGRNSVDLSTRPFIAVNESDVGVIRGPFGTPRSFMEARRVIASRNATSGFLGAAYEGHIRTLFAQGKFWVSPGRVVLGDDGQQITDLDVLAYKDGVAFIVQAKCIPEPDSVHAVWKARDHIDGGVRQCLAARSYLQKRRQKLSQLVGRPAVEVRELCCLVVTPCVRFSGDCVWPVAVVDDLYLDHLLTIGTARQFDSEGRVVAEDRLYPNPDPSGPELRNLLLRPAHVRALHSGAGGLRPVDRRIRHLTVTEFVGSDGIGFWHEQRNGETGDG